MIKVTDLLLCCCCCCYCVVIVRRRSGPYEGKKHVRLPSNAFPDLGSVGRIEKKKT